jgi:acetyl esterase/lipase
MRSLSRAALTSALAMLSSACSPVGVLNALVPQDTHFVTRDLAYGTDPRQKLDVYQPRAAARAPLVVFFYGGSWNAGERGDYRFVGEALAARGIVVAIADYRLYPEVTYPEFLNDSARAVAWVNVEAQRFDADPERLFVMGHSAGAYNAAMLALDPRWLAQQGMDAAQLAGWVGLAGPYDFLPSNNPDVQPVFHHPRYPPGAEPFGHVSDNAPPAFLGAARSDTLVDPQRNTARLASDLGAAGVPVTLRFYERVGHMTLIGAFGRPLRGLAPVLEDVADFVLEN